MHNSYDTLLFPLVIIPIMFRGTVTFIRVTNLNSAYESVEFLNGTALTG